MARVVAQALSCAGEATGRSGAGQQGQEQEEEGRGEEWQRAGGSSPQPHPTFCSMAALVDRQPWAPLCAHPASYITHLDVHLVRLSTRWDVVGKALALEDGHGGLQEWGRGEGGGAC
jgi:hypothetical protein